MEEHQIQFVLEKLASKTKMAGVPENEAIIREKTPQPTNQESWFYLLIATGLLQYQRLLYMQERPNQR